MIKQTYSLLSLLLLTGLLLPVSVTAQRGPLKNSRFYRGQSNYGLQRISFGVGTTTYLGDLCESVDCIRARPQVSLGYNYRLGGRVSVRGEFSYYRLYSTDEGGDNFRRNLSFRSGNMELYAAGVVDLFQYNKISDQRQKIRPYGFAGVGLTYINPRAELDGKWYGLASRNTEGVNYSQFIPMIPFGIGFTIQLHPVLDLSLEGSYRLTFSDYIDDVSTTFISNGSLEDPVAAALADRSFEAGVKPWDTDDGEHWRAGHQRGNPDRNDAYYMLGFKLEYTLNPIIKPKRDVFGNLRKPRFQQSNGGGSKTSPKRSKQKRKG